MRKHDRQQNEFREYAVPPELFGPLMREFGFTLDAAASKTNAQCKRFFTKKDDALSQNWGRGKIWCHAPRENLAAWVRKAYEASHEGATVVMLLPVLTSAKWFHEIILGSRAEIRFIRGRVKFVKPDGSRSTPFFDSMVVVFRPPNGGSERTRVHTHGYDNLSLGGKGLEHNCGDGSRAALDASTNFTPREPNLCADYASV